MPGDEPMPQARRFFRTTRLEAFSDGVIAIAITLLVLDLALPSAGTPLERVLDAWPFYLAYVVSFLTIGAAWLAHTAITELLVRTDGVLLRLNLLLLLVLSFLPFPTRLVAEALDDVSGQRVFVTMYGLTLLCIRLLLTALQAYARRAKLTGDEHVVRADDMGHTLVPVVIGYGVAILVGLALPTVAVALYCVIALYLVVPLRTVVRTLFPRA